MWKKKRCWMLLLPILNCLQDQVNRSLGFILSYTKAFIHTHRCWSIRPEQQLSFLKSDVFSIPAAWHSNHPKTALRDNNKSTLNRLLQTDSCNTAFKRECCRVYHFACNSRSIKAHLLNFDTRQQMITFQKLLFFSHFSAHVSHERWRKQALGSVDTDAWLIVLLRD